MAGEKFKSLKKDSYSRDKGEEMRGSDVTKPGAKRTEAEDATNEIRQYVGAPPPSSPLGGMNKID